MKLDQKTIGYINVFERQTGATIKDCFLTGNTMVFIVNTGQMGRAIGKKGINIQNLIRKFKKPIKVIEFNENIIEFVKNLIYPVKVNIENREGKIVIVTEDKKTKGQLFGRDRSKLKEMQDIVKRYFNIEISIE